MSSCIINYATPRFSECAYERSKGIRKQALLEIQIGDSTVGQVVLLSPQLLTDPILGLDLLIDHAAKLSFPVIGQYL